MKNKQAFTLIELLVVVLIIGILAAVAVPQYTLAVDKSRIMPYVQRIKDIINAEEVYHLANGEYTTDLTALDIDLTQMCRGITISNNGIYCKEFFLGISGDASVPWYGITYCSQDQCDSDAYRHNNKFYIRLSWRIGEYRECLHNGSDRGKQLCKHFQAQLQ